MNKSSKTLPVGEEDASSFEFDAKRIQEQADIMLQIQMAIAQLDKEYLSKVYTEMADRQRTRESAGILDPDPHTHLERMDFNRTKLQQFKFMLDLRENMDKIAESKNKVKEAEIHAGNLRAIFG